MSLRHRQDRASVGEEATPFLGRAAELAAIEAGIEGVCGGRGALDIFSGAAGIGKTRLLREAGWRAATRGCRVLSGGAWEGEGAPAFWPWIEVLRSYVSMHEAGLARRATTDFRALLRDALEGREPGAFVICPDIDTDAHQARFALFDRFCDFLASLARDAPLVITLDDMHWSDPAALLLLQFVAGRLAALPVWLCVASREPLPDALALSTRHPWAHHVPLRGLEPDDIAHVLRAAGCSPGPDLLRQLVTLSEGNPYFAAELGKLLSTSPPPLPGGRLSLPPTLIALVHQQLARLSPACRNLLQVAAVIGRDFDTTLVAAAMDAPPAAILELIEEAIAGRVLIPLSPTQMRFVHVLTREAIYDGLPVSARTQLHHHVASSLELRSATVPHGTLVAIAHHYLLSLPTAAHNDAASYALKAATSCHALCAYEECARILHSALARLSRHLSDVEHCEFLLLLGAAESGAGNWSDSQSTYATAVALARRAHAPHLLARAALGYRGLISGKLPVDIDALHLLQEAENGLPAGTHPLRVELQSAISRALYFSDDKATATTYGTQALTSAMEIGDPELCALAIETAIMTEWHPVAVEQVLAGAQTLLHTSITNHNHAYQFQARLFLHWAYFTLGRAQDADAEVLQAERLLSRLKAPRQHWQVLLLRSARAITRGHLQLSESLSTEAAALGLKVHDTTTTLYNLLQSFRRAALTDSLSEWPPFATALLERYPTILALKAAATLVFARAGVHHQAAQLVALFARHGFKNVTPTCFTLFIYISLAEALHILGDRRHAAQLYTELLPYANHHAVTAWGTLLDGSVHHFLGLLASTLEDDDSARSHFSRALDAHLPMEAPLLSAQTQLAFARFLVSRGTDLAYADHLASSALSIFRDCGLHALAHQAQAVPTDPPRNFSPPTGRPPSRATNFLIKNGRHWQLCYKERSVILPDSLGLYYLHRLLARPGERIHVLELVRARSTESPPHIPDGSPDSDATALAAYKHRLRDLRSALEEAEAAQDIGMREALATEIDILEREVSRSLNLFGRPRAHGNIERARVRVRNRLMSALRALEPLHPEAAAHFRHSLRTGTLCSYAPESATSWDTAQS